MRGNGQPNPKLCLGTSGTDKDRNTPNTTFTEFEESEPKDFGA